VGPHPHPPQGDAITNFLLLHGLLGQPEQWRWLEAELQGRGHTTRALALPRGTWDDEIALVHHEVTNADEPTVVVGHSLGGALVRGYAVVHPDTAFGLATIAGVPPGFIPGWLFEIGRFDDEGAYRPDLDAFLARAFPGAPPELKGFTWEQPALRGAEPEGEVTGAEPRLAILCEDDEIIPFADQQRLATLLRAPTASVPGGHSPHVRHPALIATLLLNWLTPTGA
jgi:pimeloyl-ACP methyl ester carboxylesterase